MLIYLMLEPVNSTYVCTYLNFLSFAATFEAAFVLGTVMFVVVEEVG